MTDYFLKVINMSEKELTDEIERINKMLFKMNSNSPMYTQLQDMLTTVSNQYQEKLFIERTKNIKDEVVDIGTMEGDEYTPNYSDHELLIATVDSYITPKKAD